MAIDSGIGRTYDDPLHSTWYKTPQAHNMLVVHDAELDRKEAAGRDVAWSTGAHMDCLAATHHGYRTSSGIVHRRRFLFVRPDYFLVHDEVQYETAGDAAPADRQLERKLSWYLRSPVTIEADRDDPEVYRSPAGPGLLVMSDGQRWQPESGNGMACVRGLPGYADDYAEIPHIGYSTHLRPGAAASHGVLLHPFAKSRPQVRFVRQRLPDAKQNNVWAYYTLSTPTTHDTILICNDLTRADRAAGEPPPLVIGGLEFHGACAVVRAVKERQALRETWWSAAGATRLRVGDRTVLESGQPASGEGNL
jgi:hypothetical protein